MELSPFRSVALHSSSNRPFTKLALPIVLGYVEPSNQESEAPTNNGACAGAEVDG